MTRKEMTDQVKAWLGLQDIAVLDENELIENQLYWGTIDLLARTKLVARRMPIDTTANVAEYTLDHEILALVDLEDGSVPKARRQQTTLSPAFTLVRSDVLRIAPIPSEDGVVEVWAVKRPAKMTDDGDSPGDEAYGAIPDEFQDAILTYALWKCADYADDSGSQQGERYRGLYEARLAQIRSQVNKRGTARGPRQRISRGVALPRGAWVG